MPWSAGAILTAAQLNTYAPQEWTTWTPTLTGFTVSSSSARWVRHGPSIVATYTGILNAAATAQLAVSLPVAARAAPATRLPIGVVHALDSGTNRRSGWVCLAASATVIEFWSDAATSAWAATVPFTWASGDQIAFTIAYEGVAP